jgi:hypothetical protein
MLLIATKGTLTNDSSARIDSLLSMLSGDIDDQFMFQKFSIKEKYRWNDYATAGSDGDLVEVVIYDVNIVLNKVMRKHAVSQLTRDADDRVKLIPAWRTTSTFAGQIETKILAILALH